MGNFQSICTGRTADEEGGGGRDNQYKSKENSSVEILVLLSSILKATKCILQKLCVYLRPRKAADPSLPIQNPPPQICNVASHSILEDKDPSSTGLIDDEEARNDDEIEQEEHVVSVIDVEIGACLDEIVTREEEREAKEQVKSSTPTIVVGVEDEKRINHYSSRHKILLVGEGLLLLRLSRLGFWLRHQHHCYIPRF